MSSKVPDDIVEQILVRLDLKDLIQCRAVCKSWHSLLSGSRFAVSHFITHKNNTKRRRIIIHGNDLLPQLVGSSNGLVCVSTRNADIIVVNPLTRELKKLENPPNDHDHDDKVVLVGRHYIPFLGGFGYDSYSDDYKVVLGTRHSDNEDLMRFQVLSLKSNLWKLVGDMKIKCKFIRDCCGILCNLALHWLVLDEHKNIVILSFDLSTEEFKEIPQPPYDDTTASIAYEHKRAYYRLGVVEESLCIYHDYGYLYYRAKKDIRGLPKWVMKNYNNGKQCWELLPHDAQWDDDVPLRLNIYDYDRVNGSFFHENNKQCMLETSEYICPPIYVQSLVSPQVNERPKGPVSPDVNESAKGLVSPHVIRGLKRKRHTQDGFQERSRTEGQSEFDAVDL